MAALDNRIRFSGVTGFDRCQSVLGERAEYSGSSRKSARKPSIGAEDNFALAA